MNIMRKYIIKRHIAGNLITIGNDMIKEVVNIDLKCPVCTNHIKIEFLPKIILKLEYLK